MLLKDVCVIVYIHRFYDDPDSDASQPPTSGQAPAPARPTGLPSTNLAHHSSAPVGTIVGAVIGGIVGLVILLLATRWLRRWSISRRTLQKPKKKRQVTLTGTETLLPQTIEPLALLNANMSEHRTATTISYGRSDHSASNPTATSSSSSNPITSDEAQVLPIEYAIEKAAPPPYTPPHLQG